MVLLIFFQKSEKSFISTKNLINFAIMLEKNNFIRR